MPWGAAIGAVGAIGSSALAGSTGSTGLSPFKTGTALGTAQVNKRGVTSTAGLGSEYGAVFNEQTGQYLDQAKNAPSGAINLDPNSLLGAGTNNAPGMDYTAAGKETLGLGTDVLSAFKNFDPNAFAQTQFDRLSALAAPGEATAARSTANQLFARGRAGGNDTSAANVFRSLDLSQQDAATQRALQSIGLAGTESDRLYKQGTGLQASAGNLAGTGETLNASALQRLLAGITGAQSVGTFQQNFRTGALNNAVQTQGGLQNSFQGQREAIATALTGAGSASAVQLANNKAQAGTGQYIGDIVGNFAGSMASRFSKPATTTGIGDAGV